MSLLDIYLYIVIREFKHTEKKKKNLHNLAIRYKNIVTSDNRRTLETQP